MAMCLSGIASWVLAIDSEDADLGVEKLSQLNVDYGIRYINMSRHSNGI
jgi:hypothetical protein